MSVVNVAVAVNVNVNVNDHVNVNVDCGRLVTSPQSDFFAYPAPGGS